jgi:hypothetical protein
MKIPVFVVVAQWTLLCVLSVLVIIMYRQLGRAFSPRTPAGKLGPEVGSRAASFEYTRIKDGTPQRVIPGYGQPAILAFVEPSCQACENLVGILDSITSTGELAGLRVLLIMSDPERYLQISDVFRSSQLELGRIMTRATLAAYHVTATPVLVAIDEAGFVRAAGPALRAEEVLAFKRACLLPAPDKMLEVVPAESAEMPEKNDLATDRER